MDVSKYVNLVGIAYDQPDVYETTDLPEADQANEEPEEETDEIEHLRINVAGSFEKFKGKVVNSSQVDFSDRLSKKIRTGYSVSNDWELAGCEESETPIQKYQRLKCELKELMEAVSAASTLKDGDKEIQASTIAGNLEVMNNQLEELKLDKLFGSELINKLNDPQGTQIKKMLTELEKISTHESKKETPIEKSGTASFEVKYKVTSTPQQLHLAYAARVADLEARVNKLNKIVVASPNTLNRLGPKGRSLVETSRWVAEKVALLDTTQLEAIDARMSALLSKQNQVDEHLANGQDDERNNKITELYNLVKATEDASQILPKALDRMIALEELNKQGNEFSKSLNEVEIMQQKINSSCDMIREALKRMEENFTTTVSRFKISLEEIDNRVKNLTDARKK